MQAQIQKYKDASRHLLAQANEEFAAGDFRQASEKGWGAAAQIVKAVAEKRGSLHNNHYRLFQIVDDLAEELGDTDISRFFAVASSLHTNFYEDWMPSGVIRVGLDDIDLLLAKLEPLTLP